MPWTITYKLKASASDSGQCDWTTPNSLYGSANLPHVVGASATPHRMWLLNKPGCAITSTPGRLLFRRGNRWRQTGGAYGIYDVRLTSAESGRWVMRPDVPAALPMQSLLSTRIRSAWPDRIARQDDFHQPISVVIEREARLPANDGRKGGAVNWWQTGGSGPFRAVSGGLAQAA